jgi:hypothetical protein
MTPDREGHMASQPGETAASAGSAGPHVDVPERPVIAPAERTMRSHLGPEAIASLLLVVVVGVAVAVFGPAIGAGASPAVSASPVATAPVGGTVTAAPAPTVRPWTAAARTVLAADERIVVLREELAAAVAATPAQADTIARIVRSLNVALRDADAAVDAAAAAGLPPAIVTRARDLNAAALTRGTSVLDARISNTRAYVEGGAALAALLDGVEASMTEVARVSDLPAPAPGP